MKPAWFVTIRRRQRAESGALALFFGGKKRPEDTALGALRPSQAGVLHRDTRRSFVRV
jgi:hypothetical protein